MENFLDRYQATNLNWDQINYLNSSLAPNEVEAFINSLPTKKHSGLEGFNGEFY